MSKQRTELESFVRTTLNNENDYFTKQIIVRYGERFMEMVQSLEINERTIAPGLKIMTEEIFLYGAGFYHVLTFLVFCIALDKHCKIHNWYTQKKPIDICIPQAAPLVCSMVYRKHINVENLLSDPYSVLSAPIIIT